MKKLGYSLLLAIILAAIPLVALAEDYTVPVIVGGKTYTLTVSVAGNAVTGVRSDSTAVKVGKVSPVATKPAKPITNSAELTTLSGDGFYSVGTEIATGKWTTEDGYADCYWALLDDKQNTIKNHFGVSGGTITITDVAYELEIRGCGQLIAVDNAYITQTRGDSSLLTATKKDGFYTIGVEIAPGKWETQNGYDSCYWALLDDQQETIKNHFGPSGGVINVTSDAYELEIKDCGQLIFIDVKPKESNAPASEDSSATNNPIANKAANLRGGPGTTYPVVGSVKVGQALNLVAKNADGSWLKIDSGQWIATFLVTNAPTDLPVEETSVSAKDSSVQQPAAPVQQPTATPTSAPPPATTQSWSTTGVQTCNHFEWRVTDVRRAKEVWLYDEKIVAQGEYLLVYTEIKNVSPGTSDLESSSEPRLGNLRYDTFPSHYAAWMMTGGYNVPWESFNPGQVITVVAAFDVQPSDGYTYRMRTCGQSVTIGAWEGITKGALKAS